MKMNSPKSKVQGPKLALCGAAAGLWTLGFGFWNCFVEKMLALNPGTSNVEHRTSNIEYFPFAPSLTPALSHPMGEGEVVPAFGQNRGRLVAEVHGFNARIFRRILSPSHDGEGDEQPLDLSSVARNYDHFYRAPWTLD